MNIDKTEVSEWFQDNFETHSDWTGTYVEYNQHLNSVDELIQKFLNKFYK